MSGCARKFSGDRIVSILAIAIFAAGSAGAVATDDASPTGQAAVTGEAAATGDTAATGDAAVATSPAKAVSRAHGRVRTGGSLQHRVDVLSKALQLDARQRTELLAILESQRQAVSKIWSDPKLIPAERTPATRAVEERTADQIRGILSDEQKSRYNPPKPHGTEPPSPDVEGWMQKQARARQPQ